MTFPRARFTAAALAFLAVPLGGRAASNQPNTSIDPASLEAHHVKVEAAEFLGRKAIRLTTVPPDKDGEGFALVRGTDFQDGTIDVDVAVKITTPPGVRMPGFTGLAFRMSADGASFEDVYLCNTARNRTTAGTGCVASGPWSTKAGPILRPIPGSICGLRWPAAPRAFISMGRRNQPWLSMG